LLAQGLVTAYAERRGREAPWDSNVGAYKVGWTARNNRLETCKGTGSPRIGATRRVMTRPQKAVTQDGNLPQELGNQPQKEEARPFVGGRPHRPILLRISTLARLRDRIRPGPRSRSLVQHRPHVLIPVCGAIRRSAGIPLRMGRGPPPKTSRNLFHRPPDCSVPPVRYSRGGPVSWQCSGMTPEEVVQNQAVTVTHTFAGLPVSDYAAAYGWYARLFGRPADMFPHEHEAVWRLTPTASVYVVEDRERAGSGLVTLALDDLDAHERRLSADGLALTEQADGADPRRLTIKDADGNGLTFFHDPSQSGR
jgi:hypothetical protein